jgi:sialic acid synthase SpsE
VDGGSGRTAKAGSTDAMKLQTYSWDSLTIDCDDDYFRIQGTLGHGRSLFDLYIKKAATTIASKLAIFLPAADAGMRREQDLAPLVLTVQG